MHKKYLYIMTLLLMSFLTSQCSNDTYYLSNQQAVQTTFYTVHETSIADTVMSGMTIQGLSSDSVIYSSVNITDLYLPLNLNANECSWVLFKNEGTEAKVPFDTLTFVYTKELAFISGSNGMTYKVHLQAVSHQTERIDSIHISNATIQYNENFENVKIYVRP